MRDAVRSKYIRTNPLDDVKPPKQASKDKAVLTPNEVRQLLEAVHGDRFECAFYFCSLIGLRIGECLALRFKDVDLERGTIRVERTLYNGECSAPKTQSSRRVLTLPQRADFVPYRRELCWPPMRDILWENFDLDDPKIYRDVRGKLAVGRIVVGDYFPKTEEIVIQVPLESTDYVQKRIDEVFGR
jgi:integrase